MPVQKYEAPNNNSVYEPEGPRGARHTLFSGTEVLQAGAGGCTEVLAIVTATGNLSTISQPPYRWKNSLHECLSIEFKNQSQGYRFTGLLLHLSNRNEYFKGEIAVSNSVSRADGIQVWRRTSHCDVTASELCSGLLCSFPFLSGQCKNSYFPWYAP